MMPPRPLIVPVAAMRPPVDGFAVRDPAHPGEVPGAVVAPHPVHIDPYGVPVARAPVDRREGAAGDLLIEHAPAQGDGLVPVRPVQTENERCPAVTDEDVVRFDPAVME